MSFLDKFDIHMDSLLLAGRIIIAGVFFVSSLAKLADPEGTRKSLRDFGVPNLLLPSFAILLPVAEIITTIMLIPLATAWWGAVSSAILLSVFTIAIAINLRMGKNPICNCFGQLQKTPISWKTVIRNLLLLIIAVGLVWYGRKNPSLSILAWHNNLAFFEQVAILSLGLNSVLVIGVGWLLLLLWHQQGRLLTRLEAVEAAYSTRINNSILNDHRSAMGQAIGSIIPDFDLTDLSGRKIQHTEILSPGKLLLLLFIDLKCGPCNAFLPTVSQWQQTISTTLHILIISRGNVQENLIKKSEFNLNHFFLQKDQEVARLFGIEVTPSAVLIEQNGYVGSVVATGAEAITKLVAQVVGTVRTVPTAIKDAASLDIQPAYSKTDDAQIVGQLAPQLSILDLNGQPTMLEDFRGHSTLIIFWNPSCSFCTQMLPQLRTWEIFSSSDAPQILIISVGTADSSRGLNLKAKVLLDNEFALAQQFGVKGTPSGVLLDAKGVIASPVVIGAAAIFDLVRKNQAIADNIEFE